MEGLVKTRVRWPGLGTWDVYLSGGEREGGEDMSNPWTTMTGNPVSQSTKHLREIVLAGLICNLWEATNCKLHNVALNLSRRVPCLFKMRHLKDAKLPKALAWGDWHSSGKESV